MGAFILHFAIGGVLIWFGGLCIAAVFERRRKDISDSIHDVTSYTAFIALGTGFMGLVGWYAWMFLTNPVKTLTLLIWMWWNGG